MALSKIIIILVWLVVSIAFGFLEFYAERSEISNKKIVINSKLFFSK